MLNTVISVENVKSTRALPRLPTTAAASSPAPRADSVAYIGKRLHPRFRLCAAINGVVSLATATPTLRRYQWPSETAPSSLYKRRSLWPRLVLEYLLPLLAATMTRRWSFRKTDAGACLSKAKAKAPPPK
jgi:hypothetical protein